MTEQISAGAKFRAAMKEEQPLQVIGAISAYHARLAERTGYKAIYLSGGGVAAGSLGLPDLGISNLDDVLTDVRRITDVCALPLLVDVDTGFGASAFNVARTVRSLIKFGAGAMHIEDQVGAKRCGHRPGKELVSKEEMADRIKAAVDARRDADFLVIARCNAFAHEGVDATIERLTVYAEAGADLLMPIVRSEDQFVAASHGTHLPLAAMVIGPGRPAGEMLAAGYALSVDPMSAQVLAYRAIQVGYKGIRAGAGFGMTGHEVLSVIRDMGEAIGIDALYEVESRTTERDASG